MPRSTRRRQWVMLAIFVVLVAAVAAGGSIATTSQVDGWYATAAKPAWTPPNWLFGPVWTVLYAGIALAGWLIWRSSAPNRGTALALFWMQLVLNAAWTPVFFAGYPTWGVAALWIGVVIIVALDLVVAAAAVVFWPISRTAALVMAAYLLWLLYATSLNLGVAVLNP